MTFFIRISPSGRKCARAARPKIKTMPPRLRRLICVPPRLRRNPSRLDLPNAPDGILIEINIRRKPERSIMSSDLFVRSCASDARKPCARRLYLSRSSLDPPQRPTKRRLKNLTRPVWLLCPTPSVGWMAAVLSGMEESPGSTEKRRRITSGGGDPRESATESKPPLASLLPEVRVKGCGKSAPRWRQRRRHGKPRREQNRIGTTGFYRPASPGRRPGWLLETAGNDRPRGMAIARRKAPYRTRLTGRLALIRAKILARILALAALRQQCLNANDALMATIAISLRSRRPR